MNKLRVKTKNDLKRREMLHRLLREKLPNAFLRPRREKGYLDYVLDISERELEDLRRLLEQSGYSVQTD